MRAQASLEFLSTYGFLFLMIALVLGLLAFFTFFPKSAIPEQCGSYGGPTCDFASIFTNLSGHYSMATLVLSNSQPVPINVSNITVTVRNVDYRGACTPNLVYPGQEATCLAYLNESINLGVVVQGFYTLPARFCNSAISSVTNNTCTYQDVTYSGYFTTSPDTGDEVPFAVSAMQGVPTVNTIQEPTSPYKPDQFNIVQNGDFPTSQSGSVLGYSFATSNSVYLTLDHLGFGTSTFPAVVSSLNNGNVACSPKYNATMSMSYATLYLPASAVVTTRIETTGPMELYYKASTSPDWIAVSYSANVLNWRPQTPTVYSAAVTLAKGYDNIAVAWSNTCGAGLQALNITGLPQ